MADMNYKAGELADALTKAQGNISRAARLLGCSRTTVYKGIDTYATVREAYEEANEARKDFVESRLDAILASPKHKDHYKAVRFFLRTKAKDRGYTERHEHSVGADENAAPVVGYVLQPINAPADGPDESAAG